MLSIHEVARMMQVHPNTVYDLLKSADLPGVKVGRDWRVRAESLTDFLHECGAHRLALGMIMLTTDEVASELRTTRDTVRDMCASGKLPAAKIGQVWRISPADLEAFARGEIVPPTGSGAEDPESPGVPRGVRGGAGRAAAEPARKAS